MIIGITNVTIILWLGEKCFISEKSTSNHLKLEWKSEIFVDFHPLDRVWEQISRRWNIFRPNKKLGPRFFIPISGVFKDFWWFCFIFEKSCAQVFFHFVFLDCLRCQANLIQASKSQCKTNEKSMKHRKFSNSRFWPILLPGMFSSCSETFWWL